MQETFVQRTLGENFLLSLQKAESKGELLANLKNAVLTCYPKSDLVFQVNKLSDFESVAQCQSKFAKARIMYNAKVVRELQSRLVGLRHFGNDNYKYDNKATRKLNLLINNCPTLDDMIYLAMDEYVRRGWGKVSDFKDDVEKGEHSKNTVARSQPKIERASVCSI